MRTRTEARIWVYRDTVAFSLRRRAAALKASDIGFNVTPAGVKRARAEMLKLAGWLEAKAEKLTKKADAATAASVTLEELV